MPSSLPRWPAGSDRSWDGLFQPFPCSPAAAAFPALLPGRRPHWSFRGLLNVHSRYGLPARCIAKATHLSRRLRRFRYLHRRSDSYRLERPSCRVGIAPTEDQHLRRGAQQGLTPLLSLGALTAKPSKFDTGSRGETKVESRCGAVALSHRPGSVSTPRSSNWTGGFPASSFRYKAFLINEFTLSLTNSLRLGSLELVQSQLLVQVGVRVSCRTLTPHLELRTQPLAHPVADVAVDHAVGRADGPDAKVVGPAPQLAVDPTNLLLDLQPSRLASVSSLISPQSRAIFFRDGRGPT